MNGDLKFYWSLLMRRLPVMLVLFAVAAGAGLGLAMTLPPVYKAESQLLVEGAQIPDSLAASTVQTAAAEKLQVIEQRLTTRANLIDLANRFDVFAGQGRMSPDSVVSEMREAISIDANSGRDRATLMRISFENENPRTAASVVNELVTLVLNEDSRSRTAIAGETLDFFEGETERLSTELSRLSDQILSFKSQNTDSLPDGLDFRMNRQRLLQDNIGAISRESATLAEQRVRLVQLFEAQGASALNQQNLTPAQRRLAEAEAELEEALLVYSSTNPRVKVLEAKIAKLQSAANDSVQVAGAPEGASLLDLQLSEIDTRIERLEEQRQASEAELERVSAAIERTPQTAIRLEGLEREYNNIQSQYNAALNRLATAETGERIELLSKGERITVLEQATVPDSPDSPNRLLIAGGGVFAGLALAVGFFLLMELLNRSIRRPADLTRALNIQPLATVPYLETTGARRTRRAGQFLVAGAILIGVPVALWAIHEFYLPLDLIFDRILEKLTG